MFRRFIIWIGKRLGLVVLTQDQYKAMVNSAQYYRESYEHAQGEYRLISDAYTELQKKFDEANMTSILEQKKINDELMLKQDELQKAMEKSEEYYKTVQETLSKALHKDIVFGFNRSLAFPGSTAVTSHMFKESDDPFVAISGRTIVDDATTATLKTLPDIDSKYRHLYNYMVKYGLIDRISQMLVNSGALQFTLAYNSDCTTCEVYYNVQLKKVDSQWIVDVSK